MVVTSHRIPTGRQIFLPSLMTNQTFFCDDIHPSSILGLKMKQYSIFFEIKAVRQMKTLKYLCKVSSMYILLLFQNNGDFYQMPGTQLSHICFS